MSVNDSNLDQNPLKFEFKLNHNSLDANSLEVVFCHKSLKVAADSFKEPGSYLNNFCYYIRKAWNYIRGKKVVTIDVVVDPTTKKTAQIAFGAINLNKLISNNDRENNSNSQASDSQTVINQIKFKTFSSIFFSDDERTRADSWKELSHTLPNYEEVRGFIQRVLESDPTNFQKIPNDFLRTNSKVKNDMKSLLESQINQNGLLLEFAPDEFKKDPEVVLRAYTQNPQSLLFAHKEAIIALCESNVDILNSLSEDLKKDKDIIIAQVKARVKNDGALLQYQQEHLRKEKAIVLQAVGHFGQALQYAHESLRKDREVVQTAVAQSGLAIKFADEELKKDKAIVLAAVKKNGRALEFADESLKKDKDVILAAIQNNIDASKFISKDFDCSKDRDIMFCLSASFADIFEYADKEIKKDGNFVLELVKQNGLALEFADESLKKDKAIVLAALNQNGLALKFADESLKKDREVVLAALNQNRHAFKFVSPNIEDYSGIRNSFIYSSISDQACRINDKRYFPKALSQDIKALQLPDLPENASIEHLKVDLSRFIDELTQIVAKDPEKLTMIRNELNLPEDTPLDVCIGQLKEFRDLLFNRIENKLPYLGTPPKDTQELIKFYEQIEVYLRHLDVFLSQEENNIPECFIERLQLLQTQSACGARFQAETEQLFSLNCIPAESMTLDKQLALIASTEAKKAIESITESRDVHEINIKMFQLHQYLIGDRMPKDHLAHEFEETRLLEQFFSYHTTKNLLETIQRGLKPGSQLDEIFTEYLKENFLPELTESEKAEIPAQAEEAWQENKANKKIKFEKYQKAKAENNQQMIRFLNLPKEEASCNNLEEFEQYLETKKDGFIDNTINQNAIGTQISNLYSKYFNQETTRWNLIIIAKALEKMGILETIDK